MTTMNREEQKQVLIDTANHIIHRDNTSPYSENLRELARIALAALEVEPIGFRCRRNDNLGDWSYVYHREPDDFERKHLVIEGIYAAPPAPVPLTEVQRAMLRDMDVEISAELEEEEEIYRDGIRKCIAALRYHHKRAETCSNGYTGSTLEEDTLKSINFLKRNNIAAMLQSGNFRENKNSSTNNFREIAETSTNYPVIPSEVLSAILKVAKIRADFDDFDGDRRGIGDCLDEAEQELIVTINKYASQLAAEPIATNDVREQTAVPPVPVIQADVAQAIEKLKRKLVECNRYNYCADAVKGVEYACHAAMLQGSQPVSQTYKFPVNTPCRDAPAHIWLQTAGVWPEDGELSELTWCSHNQHHDDTLYVRADLVNGNSPVTPDGWISCSEQMPNDKQYVWCWGKSYGWTEYDTFVGYYDWSRNKWWTVTDDGEEPASKVTHWMPLPEPTQEVSQ